MEWNQVYTIIGANILLLAGSIGITISLYMHTDRKFHELLKDVKDEMKDFHGRLCAIEERNKK